MFNPEELVFYQGDESTDIYFIANGEAVVNIHDTKKESFNNFRALTDGHHFGEIGVVYNCKRTASVLVRTYSTLARLSKINYQSLVGEIPEFETEMQNFILQMYNDDLPKLWAFDALK